MHVVCLHTEISLQKRPAFNIQNTMQNAALAVMFFFFFNFACPFSKKKNIYQIVIASV